MMPATGMNWFGSKLHPPSSFSGTPRTRKLLEYVLLPKQEEHNEPGTKDQHAGPARPGGRRLGLFPSPLVPDFFGDGLLGNVLLMLRRRYFEEFRVSTLRPSAYAFSTLRPFGVAFRKLSRGVALSVDPDRLGQRYPSCATGRGRNGQKS